MDIRAVCDKRQLCKKWGMAGRTSLFHNVHCYFNSVKEMGEREGPCCFHPRNRICRIGGGATDCLVTGLPCAPYTQQRGDRHLVLPQRHPDFQCLLDLLEFLDENDVRGGFIEEVMGWAHKLHKARFIKASYCAVMPPSWAAFTENELKKRGFLLPS